MALGEGVTGTIGSELDGVQAHTSTEMGEQVYVHGRAVGWLRGYASGEQILGGLFKQYSVDAHVDTARRDEFTSAFRQLIDPTQFYPVYGDQSTEEKLINSNGPVYVLIKADSSQINVGNFRTTLRVLSSSDTIVRTTVHKWSVTSKPVTCAMRSLFSAPMRRRNDSMAMLNSVEQVVHSTICLTEKL